MFWYFGFVCGVVIGGYSGCWIRVALFGSTGCIGRWVYWWALVAFWISAGLSVRGLSFLEGFFGYFRIILCSALAAFLLSIKYEMSKQL